MEKVTFLNSKNQKLVGILDIPKGVDTNKKLPLLLILHGFGSTKETVTSWTHIANDLGIATFRFDFSGTGESEGVYAEKTLTNFLDDAKAALASIQTFPNIDQEKIGIAGHSMGATTALLMAAMTHSFSCCIALSVATKPKEVIANFYTDEELEHMEEKGYVELRKTGERKRLNKEFFTDAGKYDVNKEAQKIEYSFLVVSAEQDDVVPFTQVQQLKETVFHAVVESIATSDHNITDEWKPAEPIIREWLQNWLKKHE